MSAEAETEEANFEIFRDCLSSQLVAIASAADIEAATKDRKKARKQARQAKGRAHRPNKSVDTSSVKSCGSLSDGFVDGGKGEEGVGADVGKVVVEDVLKSVGGDRARKSRDVVDSARGSAAEELAEFIDYLASDIFPSLPSHLRTLSYTATQHDPTLLDLYSLPLSSPALTSAFRTLPPSTTDSLTTYDYTTDPSDTPAFLSPTLATYITSTTSPPPIYKSTRTSECELCDRDWIPLTYHHLIPRQMHGKAVKKGWAEEWELNKVAWLCRACHNFVHRVCSNEELAREFCSVEALAEREDVIRWVGWVGGVRWKKR